MYICLNVVFILSKLKIKQNIVFYYLLSFSTFTTRGTLKKDHTIRRRDSRFEVKQEV